MQTPVAKLVLDGVINIGQAKKIAANKEFLCPTKPYESPIERGVFVYGESRVGKSTYARHHYGPDSFILSEYPWFCGYNGEKVIVYEDADPLNKDTMRMIKIWTDS